MKGFLSLSGLKKQLSFKYRYRNLSYAFMVFLLIPVLTYPLLRNIISAEIDELYENRNLNQFEFSLQNFGVNFDLYYQDNFPYRNSLISLYNKYYNRIYGKYLTEESDEHAISEEQIQNELLITGNFENNELFVVEEPAIINTVPEPKEKDLRTDRIEPNRRFLNILIDADNYFTSINKKIIFQVCPKKYYISSRITGTTELDLFSLYIEQNTNVSFSYPKKAYLGVEPNYITYDEYNGHHNFLGAYVSWQEIQRKAGIETTDIANIDMNEFQIDVRKIVSMPYNINCCYPYNQDLPLTRKTEHITSINYNIAYKPYFEIETLNSSKCYHAEYKSGNKNGKTLFITGDSFFETQLQFAAKDFEFTTTSHLYDFDAGRKDEAYRTRIKGYIESADVIVIVLGENNIWSNDLKHNPGLEHRISLILELAREIY